MTKRFLYILTLAALTCSCVKELPATMPVFPEDELGFEHDGKVTLGFTADFGGGMAAGTKALGEAPDIQNMYVAVFDATGYKLSEYVKANPVTTGPLNDHKYQFTIQLKISDKPRTLHFIANGPRELRFGTEQEVIGELYTRYDADESDEYSRKDAYWQRLVFSKISPRPITSDPDSLAAYNSMVETLSNLKLIRNFSKVTLSKRTPGEGDTQEFKSFEIKGMWFVNYPDRGSIAPYNRNTGGFGTDTSSVRNSYLDYGRMVDVEDPEKGNYQGFTLASTEFIIPSVFNDGNMIAADANVAYGYVFEREKALNSPMYLIIKGRYNGVDAFYKIAMQDKDGDFYAMLRNFNYTVQIQDVSSSGFSSAAEALAGAPTGDISVNIDYQDLPNISDGNARITVSATKLLIVGQDGHPATAQFWYKYEPDITVHGDTGIHNDVAHTGTSPEDTLWNHSNPHVLITYEGSEGSSGPVISNLDVAGSNEGGNRYVTITSTNASATPKTQSITIEGRKWDGYRYMTITRTVELVLRDALEMSISASPNTDSDGAANVRSNVGQPVVLHLCIDKDLPSSMFPLAFKLNPAVNSLTPDNAHTEQDLPVRVGTDASGHPDYWFERVVNWGEYQSADVVDGKKEIRVYFETILADNATSIEVTNDYFVSGTAFVRNYIPETFSNLSFSGDSHKVGTTETFSFTMSKVPDSGKVTVAMKGLEPVSESGTYIGSDSDGFNYIGRDSDGYWLYEYNVSSTSASFNVVPYAAGDASIKLSAFLYDDAEESLSIIDPDVRIFYVNEDGTGSGTQLISFISTDVNSGKVVVGQHVTLAFYVLSSLTGTVSLTDSKGESYNATKSTSGTDRSITVGGVEYSKYALNYTVPAYGDVDKGYTDQFIVRVNGAVGGSFSVPVYGIELGDKLTSVSFDTEKYYVIQNNSTDRYLYNKESTTSASEILKTILDFSSLVKFGSTTSTSNVSFVKVGSNTQYYLGSSGNTNVSLRTSDYSWTISDTFRFSKGGTRFIYDNSVSVAISNSSTTNSNRYWNIYPVTFVEP